MNAMDDALITVNGIGISQAQISEEAQNYSIQARQQAARALVARELLLQEAITRGLCDRGGAISKPAETIERLLAIEIKVPKPNIKSCQRYFKEHRESFSTAAEFDVSHVFFPAPPGNQEARSQAKQLAQVAVEKITANPACFDDIASQDTFCSTTMKGGHIGRVSKGQTVPAFEAALIKMNKGDISISPVETEVGFHIIRVNDRNGGGDMPFEAVKEWISQNLMEQNWRKAVSQYVQVLAERATINGFDLQNTDEFWVL